MLKPRQDLENYLAGKFSKLEDNKEKQSYYLQIQKEFNIPIGISSDIIAMRKDLSEYNEFILFAITSVVANSKIKHYFTEREIENYSTAQFEEKKIKGKIKIPMLQVTDDQWIGVTTAQFLMQLRDAQLINYNADTQRALQIMVKNGKEILRPSTDYKSVDEIAQAFADKIFIPNTISLNINLDNEEDADFEFVDNEMIINKINHFDIFDGYHRYLAIGRNYDKDNSWDYPMELRITNFSIRKAKQFIYQEDHKTKMKRIKAATYNQYDYGNMVVEKINSDSGSNYFNNINLGKGLIDAGYIAQIINATYFADNKKYERIDVIRVAKELSKRLNEYSESVEEYLERRWLKYETYIIIYGLYMNYDADTIASAVNTCPKSTMQTLNSKQKITKSVLDMVRGVY